MLRAILGDTLYSSFFDFTKFMPDSFGRKASTMTNEPVVIGLLSAFAVSVLANLVTASLLVFLNSEGVKVFSLNNLLLTGEWKAEFKTPSGQTLIDYVKITRQFMGLFAGIVTTIIDNKPHTLHIRGRFIKPDIVRYWFWPNQKMIDYGTGMFQITDSGKKGNGFAVFYGVATEITAPAITPNAKAPIVYGVSFTMEKQ